MVRTIRTQHWFPLVIAAVAGCGGEAVDDRLAGLTVVQDDPTDLPIRGIDGTWTSRFLDGDVVFERVHHAADGLGPLYIRQSCQSCHGADSKGPGAVTKMVVLDDAGSPAASQEALPWGHTVRPQLEAGAVTPIDVPDEPTVFTSVRVGPAVFGRGYLEAIDDAEIERVAAAQAAAGSSVTGRIHRVCRASAINPDQPFHQHQQGDCGLIGRFGLKARIATLDDFSADAYAGDMGITSPLRPVEHVNPDGLVDDDKPGLDVTFDDVNLAADYVRLIALPRRSQATLDGVAITDGPDLFDAAQCGTCHVPSLRTRSDYPIPQLADIDAPVYTDLLLHDMGEGLADWLADGDATGTEWRTAPLIGLRHLGRYLHDGRAATLDEAIRAHASVGSEANGSVDLYLALPDDARARLLAWVASL